MKYSEAVGCWRTEWQVRWLEVGWLLSSSWLGRSLCLFSRKICDVIGANEFGLAKWGNKEDRRTAMMLGQETHYNTMAEDPVRY